MKGSQVIKIISFIFIVSIIFSLYPQLCFAQYAGQNNHKGFNQGQQQYREQNQSFEKRGPGRQQQFSGDKRQGNNKQNIVQMLNLTNDQKEQIKKLRDSHMSGLKGKKESITNAKKAFEDGIKANKSDSELMKLHSQYENAKAGIAKDQLKHILEIRSILTDEQKETFAKFGHTMFNKQGGKKGPKQNRGGQNRMQRPRHRFNQGNSDQGMPPGPPPNQEY